MTVNTINENGKVTLALDGWLDTAAAPVLEEAVEAIEEAEELVLDFENVEYMASAGLRQVLSAHKKANELEAAFSVVNVCPDVMNIFSMTGIDGKLKIVGKEE